MNEALSVWGHKGAATRSPTGVAQMRSGSRDKKGYPKFTPEKVQKIQGELARQQAGELLVNFLNNKNSKHKCVCFLFVDKLEDRIKEGSRDATSDDIRKRSQDLRYWLGQRACSSRKILRSKGYVIPSPEEVWAAKEADPLSDGTSAFKEV